MIARRKFLQWLGIGPIAAPLALDASQEQTTNIPMIAVDDTYPSWQEGAVFYMSRNAETGVWTTWLDPSEV